MKGNSADRKAARKRSKAGRTQADAEPKLLSGGNPQIAKADGDAPVQAYIAAMPDGNATSGAGSTRSSCGPCPTCAKP